MGFQSAESKFTFSFAADRTEARLIADGLELLEYPYNLLAVQSRYADGDLADHDLRLMERAVRTRETLGVARANCALRHLLEGPATLTVVNLRMSSPIQIDLKGVAEAIRAIVDLFDPYKWGEKKEDLRHKREMNRDEERRAFSKTQTEVLENAVKSYELMTNVRQLEARFTDRLEQRDMQREDAPEYARAVTTEALREAAAVRRGEVDIRALPPGRG